MVCAPLPLPFGSSFARSTAAPYTLYALAARTFRAPLYALRRASGLPRSQQCVLLPTDRQHRYMVPAAPFFATATHIPACRFFYLISFCGSRTARSTATVLSFLLLVSCHGFPTLHTFLHLILVSFFQVVSFPFLFRPLFSMILLLVLVSQVPFSRMSPPTQPVTHSITATPLNGAV